MATISVCVIVKNEAENIARCLKSTKEIVKEMIVVDTGSTDNTTKIAEELGAKIFHFAWNDDFSAARNYALEQATGDWIIFLDADEYVPEDKVHNIPPLIAKINGNRKISVISCLMEHIDGIAGPLKCRDKTARLFRNSSAIRYTGRIHETILKHGKPFDFVLYAPQKTLSIIHTGYTSTNFIGKIKRNLALLEKDLTKKEIPFLTYYYLCHSYSVLKQYGKAIEFARKALENGMVSTTMFAHKPYIILIESLRHTCEPATVEPILEEALQKYGTHPEVLASKGNYLLEKGCYTKALKVFQQALKVNESYNNINLANDFFTYIFRIQETIAAIYDKKGDTIQALNYYVMALKTHKHNADAFAGLIEIVRSQEAANIVFLLNTIYDITKKEDIHFIVKRLSALKVIKALAYYEGIWSEKFDHGERTGMLPFLHNDLEEAFILFAAAFKKSGDYQSELMAIVTLLLGNRPLWLEALADQWQPSFRRIAKTYLGIETNVLTQEDFPRYLDIVANFAHLCSKSQMNHLLQIGLLFFLNDAPIKIAQVLENHHLYQYALTVYNYELNQPASQADIKILYLRAGICCYKLKAYRQAVNFFTQALENGYDTPVIHEYLNWTQERCPDCKQLLLQVANRKKQTALPH